MHRYILALLGLLPFCGSLSASEHRQLGAHVHGVGQFNMAIEGDRLMMELEAPGMDIVGFEHAADSESDKATMKQAKALLLAGDKVFALPVKAACKMKTRKLEIHHHHHHHEEGEGDEAHEHEHEHEHGEHEHEEGALHSEFHVSYELKCTAMDQLEQISFPYFTQFKNAHKLNVQIVTDKKQGAFVATPQQPQVQLGALLK